MLQYYIPYRIFGKVSTRQQEKKQGEESFLNEAFACVDCLVLVEKLNKDALERICKSLKRPQKTRPKHQMSPTSQRRQDGALFKPPVPYPLNTVDVETMDAESKHKFIIILIVSIVYRIEGNYFIFRTCSCNPNQQGA